MRKLFPIIILTLSLLLTVLFLDVNAAANDFGVKLSTYVLRQGDTLAIRVSSAKEPKGTLAGAPLAFVKVNKVWVSAYGINPKKTPGNYRLTISTSTGRFDKYITVNKKNFPVTKLVVTSQLAEQGYSASSIQENILGGDGQDLTAALDVYNPKAYFKKNFVYPLDEIDVAGAFGNIRKSGGVQLQHLGVDLNAEIGDPVYAINSGQVVFTEQMINNGNTIILDHGLGIYSLYLHLDEFNVALGDMVERGDIIASAGNTGYSLGSHLHFSVKINNKTVSTSVDPLRFIAAMNKMMK